MRSLAVDLAHLSSVTTPGGPFVNRTDEIFRLARDPRTYKVSVASALSLGDYRRITRPRHWALLQALALPLRDRTVVFINPTMEGGGVAMLRPPLMHLLRLLGVDAHWYVTGGRKNPEDPNPYLFTKLLHNILQRRTAPDVRITEEGKSTHRAWNSENFEVLARQETVCTANLFVIDDPQPAPLIPLLKECNPGAKIVWRNHIDNSGELMRDPTTAQGEVWTYLRDECGVGMADAFIFHPVEVFVPPDIRERTFFAPATVEPYDDLNRPLSDAEIREGISFINAEVERKNRELAGVDAMSLLRLKRPRIALIARFDESKGMDIAMELGVAAREEALKSGIDSEVLIIGNGSVDDPSGTRMYEKVLARRQMYAEETRKNIIVMCLKHNYVAMNAVMHSSRVALQTSLAEGFETRISDWVRHGVPVVVANRGGMPLQVAEGVSGIILDYDKPNYDLKRGAAFVSGLLTNPEKHAAMRRGALSQAEAVIDREFTTPANAARLLRLFACVLVGESRGDTLWRMDDLVARS
ncbi:MAG: glycosyltransferase [bacterium]|nr:glycosyltransferase [bacterium]